MMAHVVKHVRNHDWSDVFDFCRNGELQHIAEVFLRESELPSVQIELEAPVILVEIRLVHHLTHSCL